MAPFFQNLGQSDRNVTEFSFVQRRTLLLISFVCIILILSQCWNIWKSYQDSVTAIAIESNNLSLTLAQQVGAVFDKAQTAVDGIIRRIQIGDLDQPQNRKVVRDLVEYRVRHQPDIAAIIFINNNGNATDISIPQQNGEESLVNSDFFQFHRLHSNDESIFIGKMRRNRQREWVIPVSQIIKDNQKKVLGMILIELQLGSFEHILSSVNLGKAGTASLTLSDGTVLLHSPFNSSDTRQNYANVLILATAGSRWHTTDLDDTKRYYSYHQLENYPLIMIVGISRNEQLLSWRISSLWLSIQLVVALAAIILLAVPLLRLIKASALHASHLQQSFEKQEELNHQLQELVRTDALTGLANRRCLFDYMKTEISRASRMRQPIGIIMMDVDFFKQYNDTYGHGAGDDCLVMIAQYIQTLGQCRATDLSARYGGEEFCIVLPDTDEAGSEVVARRLIESLDKAGLAHNISPLGHITMSAGVFSSIPTIHTTAMELINYADQALYYAKNSGRNRVVRYSQIPWQHNENNTSSYS